MTKDNCKEYIMKQVHEKGFDEYGQLRLDFTDLYDFNIAQKAAIELGYDITPGQGFGIFYITL